MQPRHSDIPSYTLVPVDLLEALVRAVERHRGEPLEDELEPRWTYALGYATAVLSPALRPIGFRA
jgi:hypothetical protein